MERVGGAVRDQARRQGEGAASPTSKAVCRPDGEHWTNERVVVFTEYRDTQIWLKELLAQDGHGRGAGPAAATAGWTPGSASSSGWRSASRPTENQVRILLATDAASEGIDLHEHCHRLVNYDIPFNPNKLEQRIGRIDRYGQPEIPEVRHFIGPGWETSRDSYEADLEFLARVAVKVARMEEDLGTVNAVLADAVQQRMLGEIDRLRRRARGAAAERQRRRGTGRVAADSQRLRAGGAAAPRPGRDRRGAADHPGARQAAGGHRAGAGRRAAAQAGHRRDAARRGPVRGARR